MDEILHMEIRRDNYLEELKSRMGGDMVKVITGVRRCGKSYLLFKIFKKYLLNEGVRPNHIIEIALDEETMKPYDPVQRNRELAGLKRTGDFFAKIVVRQGFMRPTYDSDGILHVGLVPFLLEQDIVDDAMKRR